jgi:hypothetical protein
MMTIEQLWNEMEAEGGSVWRMRLARKEGAHPLVVALDPHTHSRVLLVAVPGVTLPPRREWPECRGLEWLTISLEGVAYWGVRLRDATSTDVFAALARDLDDRLATASGPENAAAGLFGRLKCWQQFLRAWQDGMSLEARRGLWGELHVLHVYMLPVLGPTLAVTGWKASTAAHQDFQFPHAAVEIKTSSAKQPQSIRITSERQLDETGVGTLFLHVVIVDEREVSTTASTPGQSLPAVIAAIRTALASDPSALALFNDRLFDRGWLDAQTARYEDRRLTVREEITCRVVAGFPRILESDLQIGVGDVNYALNLAACMPFAVSHQEMQDTLARPPSTFTPP